MSSEDELTEVVVRVLASVASCAENASTLVRAVLMSAVLRRTDWRVVGECKDTG